MFERFDVIVVGSGIAGLSVALAAAPKRVAVVSRGALALDGASCRAQGGIAAAIGSDDDAALHARDTLSAGAHHNASEAVARLTGSARSAVDWLDAIGVAFDRRDGALALGREAAHSRARIVHASGDASGAAIMRALASAVRRADHIHVFEHCQVDALLRTRDRVGGVRARRDDTTFAVAAPAVVLATGGIGALYRYTTNPSTADASGLALALSVGAELADLEFVQFHPTALAPTDGASGQLPLLTEALRGAGAVLVNSAGQRFMCGVSAHAELAPRDVVARAVWSELQRGQTVFLDATRAVGDAFARRFPTVHGSCIARGLDPARSPIPVVPAQHYHMGGIRVDARGRSSIAGLYAVGEVACSGVHGANRLASNSLLEGVVFGRSLGMALALDDGIVSRPTILDSGPVVIDAPPAKDAAALADLLWQHCGLVRDDRGLGRALVELDALDRGIAPAARARVAVARRIVLAARARRDSLGAHWRADGACARAG